MRSDVRAVLLGSLIGGLASLGCNGFVGEWMIQDGFGARFAAVDYGQTREQVTAAIGPAARESMSLELPQREGYETVLREALESRSSRYLYWDTGVDEVAVVGLNDLGKVVFKCRAGT